MSCSKMDNDTAQVLLREGATFVLLDMPASSEFGIDYSSWTVGPKFRGVKMIPPGVHFIYYSSTNSEGCTGMRCGFFHNFKQREMLIRKWDKYNEEIKPDEVSEEERLRFSSNMKELDQYLGAYPYEHYKKWVSLTNHVTPDLLPQLQPACGTITSVAQFESQASNSKMRKDAEMEKLQQKENEKKNEGKAKKEKDHLPKMTIVQGTDIRFSKVSKKLYPDGATPQEITKHSMDSTYRLDTLLQTQYPGNEKGILGEIQFAFICFLIGQVYDAFDQWKKLVHLMCSSEEALNTHSDLYMDFISVLHFQVHEIPEDFFVDIVSANNFLTTTLHELFSNLEGGNGGRSLQARGGKFKEHLTKKFKWDFSSEPDEFAPVIVDT